MVVGTSLRGVVLAILAGCAWGFSGACGQYLFQNYPFDAKFVTAVRLLSAGIILVAFNFIKSKKASLAIFKNKKDFGDLLKFTLLGLLPGQLFFLMVVEASNAGTATVLQYTSVIIVMVYVCFAERRRPSVSEFLALILVVVGTVLLATRGDFSSLYLSPKVLVMGFISALGLALTSIFPKNIVGKYDVKVIIGYAMLTNGLILSLYESTKQITGSIDFNAIIALGGLSIIGTVLAFDFYLKGLAIIGPAKTSMLCTTEPVSAVILSALWLGTVFVKTDIVGIVLIIAAVLLLSYDSLKKDKSGLEKLRKDLNEGRN